MSNRIDITNQRFGHLVAIRGVGKRDNKHGYWWKCRCDCGNLVSSNASDLRSGHKKSCGCYGRSLGNGESVFNAHYGAYIKSAKIKRRIFNLTKEEFRKIVLEPCYYCGEFPMRVLTHKGCRGSFVANGVDRVDSDKGYTLDNVVPCCPECNMMKMDLSINVFLARVHKIANNVKLKSNFHVLRKYSAG
jgi:hypothetical protein